MEYSRDYKQKYTKFMSRLKPKVCVVCVCMCVCVRVCAFVRVCACVFCMCVYLLCMYINSQLFLYISSLSPVSLQGAIPNYIEIPIRRDRLMEDSFFHIMRVKNPEHLKARVMIKFQGEEGLDFGGLSR